MRKLLKFILAIVCIYAIFVAVECIRLKYANQFTKPLVVFNIESTNEEMNFTSLGFKVEYKIKRVRQTYDLELVSASEGKFVLFDTFTLWTNKYEVD